MNKPSQDQVWVTVRYVVQTHPYENATIEMGTSQTIKDSEIPEDIRKALCDKLSVEVVERGEDLRNEIRRYRRHRDDD